MLKDQFGRVLKTLRLSVTDRCEMRCLYCMPEGGVTWLPSENLLTLEEQVRVVRQLATLGLDRVKITGGEPLLYPHLVELVQRLASLPLLDLSLTTNGSRLETLAGPLKKAGLKRVTVSLDSLNETRFKTITRGGDLKKIWRGIQVAEAAGLSPVKINCVVLQENFGDVVDLARLTLDHPWEIRFIEYMPVTSSVGLKRSKSVPPALVKNRVESAFGKLEPAAGYSHAPSTDYRLPGAQGKIGFISSVSESFCARCDRLRVSADGFLRFCMANPQGLDLKKPLRSGMEDADLRTAIREAVWGKPEGHDFWFSRPPAETFMSQVGG